MKKRISLLLILSLVVFSLIGCGGSDVEESESEVEKQADENVSGVIKLGVSPDPHAKIAGVIIEDLAAEGIEVELIEFNDYVTPNRALESGEIDANFFQHAPYLEEFIEKEDLALVSLGGIHIEPMAVFSDKIESLDDLEDGSTVGIPNDTVNAARALLVLEAQGLIKLDEDAGIEATSRDVVENPKNLDFKEIEAPLLPRTLPDLDIAVINGNYALESGLNPVHDGIAIEDSESPYVNIIAIREKDADNPLYAKLLEALTSDKIKRFIEEEYEGAVVPAF